MHGVFPPYLVHQNENQDIQWGVPLVTSFISALSYHDMILLLLKQNSMMMKNRAIDFTLLLTTGVYLYKKKYVPI